MTSARCRRCGYDLHGLPTSGQCPECGLAVGETLDLLLDPAASRLPTLNDPRGVGDGLLGLAVTTLLAALVLALPGGVRLISALGLDPHLPVRIEPGDAALLASAIGLTGMWWARLIARGPAERPRAMRRTP